MHSIWGMFLRIYYQKIMAALKIKLMVPPVSTLLPDTHAHMQFASHAPMCVCI